MYIVVVHFEVKPEAVDAFRIAVLAQAEQSLSREAACRVFDVAIDHDRETDILLYEIYNDEAAFRDHLETAHFRDFNETVQPMIVSKRVNAYRLLSTRPELEERS